MKNHRTMIAGWTVEQSPDHVAMDADHAAVVDPDGGNCVACGYAAVDVVPAHGWLV